MPAPTALLLVNARARRAALAHDPAIRRALAARWRIELLTPTSADDTTRLAAEAADAGIALVIAAGGDGTARAVAQALAGRDTVLGVLPLGTANDLARALRLSRDPLAAARRLAVAEPRAVDVVDAGARLFATVGGLGLVTRSALDVTRLKARGPLVRGAARLAGTGIYKLTAAAALLAHGGDTRRLRLSHLTPAGARHDETYDVHGVFVANQRYLGGGLRLPPASRDDDGVFELCLVLRTGRARLLEAFARLTLRLPIPDRVLAVVPAREAHLVTSRPDVLLGDGDALAEGSLFHLRARPRALRVLC